MAQEAWVIAGVVALVALQFVVYRLLRRWTDTSTSPTKGKNNRPNNDRLPSHAIPGEQQPDLPTGLEDDPGIEDGVQCPTCGALNGPDFTFCRRCTNRLGG